MKTKESTKKRIKELQVNIYEFYASCAEFFTDAETYKDVKDDNKLLEYLSNYKNIKEIVKMEEIKNSEIDLEFINKYIQSEYDFIKYKNGCYYFIDSDLFAERYDEYNQINHSELLESYYEEIKIRQEYLD
jgi:hypothetical protein